MLIKFSSIASESALKEIKTIARAVAAQAYCLKPLKPRLALAGLLR